jgi:hypothetical protein
MKAANEGHQQRATRPSAPTDLQTEMSEEEGSEIDGPARAPGQISGSLTRPDLSCGATFLPEDLTFAPLLLSLRTGDRGFESLHRRVHREPDFLDQGAENFMRSNSSAILKNIGVVAPSAQVARKITPIHLTIARGTRVRIPFPPSGVRCEPDF